LQWFKWKDILEKNMKKFILPILLLFIISYIFLSDKIEENNEIPDINAIPDAVPIYSEGNTYILTDPTSEYKHGVLGDQIEAKSLSIIQNGNLKKIDFSPRVFEGLFPTLGDLNGDGEKEIIATLSGDGAGSQIVVYNQNGGYVASSDTVSSGWRHVLAVGPFGPNGEIELVDVLKPHVIKEVEFFRLNGSSLVKVAGIRGYSTHTIGSRNLGLFGVIGGGDVLLVVPTSDFKSVAALRRTDSGVEEVWKIAIDEEVESIRVEGNRVLVNDVFIN
jgi:hypothetical protein